MTHVTNLPSKFPILLAEDDPVTRLLLSRLLEKAGYEIESVVDGAQALAKIQQRFFPILITDWEMPQLDGLALCKALRSLPLDGYVYIYLLTAREGKEHIIAGLNAGADDFLTKPIHEAELVARLNTGARIVALEQNLRAANERSRVLAITDALTGAYNRRYLMEQLPREIERSRRYGRSLAAIVADIDHFKTINDRHGHGVGDEVLHQFAARAQRSIRAKSDWIARYGGEEFVLVLPETPLAGAMLAAEKIRAQIEAEAFGTTAGGIPVTASFGVSAVSTEAAVAGLTLDELIRVADACLYESKHAGRNRVTGRELDPPPPARAARA